ncbi:serine/arginine repetitive matrix protein 2 [Parambassis ranga]|uniref:Serine/arginine repetitive matrix protein 2 n=1 Tax=Parambassis ranga TaxID=210632 RepID=A0A6P7JQG8_9TELE|nr:serine/arginine repetitive matrix protein 2-like [Parambassis ranga]
MYRQDKPPHRPPPPFGPPPPHGFPFRFRGPSSGPPSGHLPPRACGAFSASALDSHYADNRTPRGHFISPPCSSFSIDRSTVSALGGSQQIVPPAEPPDRQVPRWNTTTVDHRPPDNSERAGEEFLRCIAANKPLPDYLKGNMAYNLAEAFKSANVLKEAVRSDLEGQKHLAKSRSRSRSRSCDRNRGRSRGRSRAKSRARGKSRVRSRSRGRSKSRAKSRARSKSRVHSRSRSWSQSRSKKSHVRSKSRVRRSRSSSSEKSHGKDKKRKRSPDHNSSSNSLAGNSLLEGLKLVMNSKELEERLPTLKDAILTVKASDESKKVDRHESSQSPENDSMLLPHERVGSDFSWLQGNGQHDSPVQKADELEDEESFLYGNESSQIGGQTKLPDMDRSTAGTQRYQQNKSMFRSLGDLFDPPQKGSSNPVLDRIDFEKVKSLSKNLGTLTDISEIMAKVKELPSAPITSHTAAVNLALPALSNPSVRQALESLQSLIKATKEKRTQSDDTPQTSSDKQKAGSIEDRRKERLAKVSQMESLGKELEELLNQDGINFLIPVIGFYCQKCEEFIGDISSAEKHGASHQHSNSSTHKVSEDRHAKDNKGNSNHHSITSKQHPHPTDRRDHKDYGYHRDSGEHRDSRTYQRNWRDDRDNRSKQLDSEQKGQRLLYQENLSLKDEMTRERMLITVSRGGTPPPLSPSLNVKIKEEVKKEQAAGNHSKIKVGDVDGKDRSSKGSREQATSSDSSDDYKGNSAKSKHAKKKKKKEKKKKKGKEKEHKS